MTFSVCVPAAALMLLAVCCSTAAFVTAAPMQYFVNSATGSDSNNGTSAFPFASLTRARDAVRDLKRPLPAGGVEIMVQSGDYYPAQTGDDDTLIPLPAACHNPVGLRIYTLSIFVSGGAVLTLTDVDSGEPGAPIVYRGDTSTGGSSPRLMGGTIVPADMFSTWKGSVLMANLTKLGYNSDNFGQLQSGGLGTCANDRMTVFFNGKPALLAR